MSVAFQTNWIARKDFLIYVGSFDSFLTEARTVIV